MWWPKLRSERWLGVVSNKPSESCEGARKPDNVDERVGSPSRQVQERAERTRAAQE
jgi:hypothetical protein